MKEHPFFWHSFVPEWFDMDKDTAMERIDRHIREICEAYGGGEKAMQKQAKITEWLYRIWFSHPDAELCAIGGRAKLHGFYGDYEISVEHNGKVTKEEISFTKNGKKVFKIAVGK